MTAKKHKKLKHLLLSLNLVVSIIAVLVTIGIAYYSSHSNSKNLCAYLEKKSYAKSPDFPIFKSVQILIDDKLVQNVVYLKIRFLNLGNDIAIEDFDSPIQINFKNIVEILDARIVDRVPVDIGCDADFSQRQVVVSKTLINHNDSFTVEALCSITAEADEYVEKIYGRIKGLHQIQYYECSAGSASWGWLKWRFIVILPLFYLYFAIWRMTDAYKYRYGISTELCMYIGVVMILLPWLLDPILPIFGLK